MIEKVSSLKARLQISRMNNEIDMLKMDASRMEKKAITKMSQSLLESKFNTNLDHVDAAWDEHRKILRFFEDNLKWQRF